MAASLFVFGRNRDLRNSTLIACTSPFPSSTTRIVLAPRLPSHRLLLQPSRPLSPLAVDSLSSCSVCFIIARSPTKLLNDVKRWYFTLTAPVDAHINREMIFQKVVLSMSQFLKVLHMDPLSPSDVGVAFSNSSAFLNWDEEVLESESEQTVLFQSLVATVKLQPVFDASLEAKAVKFLESVDPDDEESADAFLISLGRTNSNYLTDFVQSFIVLLSSTNQVITTAAMKMLGNLFLWCSHKVHFTLVKADLIPQIINTLNPQSHSFADGVDIHIIVTRIINQSLWLATPNCLAQLRIEDVNKQQAVHETIFQQVLAPSEKYICRLCVNRFSIIDVQQSSGFILLLTWFILICPYYQPTMDIVLRIPVFLTIPGCLTFFDTDFSIRVFLNEMGGVQQEWNKKMGVVRHHWMTMYRKLRTEGIEDVIEEKQQNDHNSFHGDRIVVTSIEWNNLLGMNVPEQEWK